MSALWAVFDKRSVTRLSRRRLPKKSMPSSGSAAGVMKPVSRRPTMGNMMRVRRETAVGASILMRRSSLVVSAFMIGG